MSPQRIRMFLIAAVLAITPFAIAEDDPRHIRHEMMEGVKEAAGPVGEMLKGERDYDADVVMESLHTFKNASMRFGSLFPPGTETGMDTEAAPAIWEDREGFEAALAQWQDAVGEAIEANPQTLDDAKPAVGAVFNACKNCHDTYRIEHD